MKLAIKRAGRWTVYAVLLGLLALLVPDAGHRQPQFELVKAESADAVDAGSPVLWLLALGSDARPGESVLGSRSDAIQLIGINTTTGASTTIGIPRDSYVDIPGHGRDRINAAMVYGGPQLTAQTVANMVGIQPDYVFIASFRGLMNMVASIGGIRVRVRWDVTTPVNHYRPGMRTLDALEVLDFSRIRHGLPGGDFDRSLDQSSVLRGGLRRLLDRVRHQGGYESALYSFMRNVETDLSPAQLYRLGRAVLQAKASLVRQCVVPGGTGYVGASSVVFPDVSAARSLAAKVRDDATLHGPCF
jgi:polyisoprenyl-teichoic acid--peptidoglycan teichoic acid transferase